MIAAEAMSTAGFYLQGGDFSSFQQVPGEPTRTHASGIGHGSPISLSGGRAEVKVQWTAPDEPRGTTFMLSVVAANGNGMATGDTAGYVEQQVVWGCEPVTLYRDDDGDGYGSEVYGVALDCGPRDGWALEPGDCDGDDETVHPDATEICNGVDDDCDGDVDEDSDPRPVYLDEDDDGFGVESELTHDSCELPVGFAYEAGDCDDARSEAHPGAEELCNSLDDNCNARTDEEPDERCGVGWCERRATSCAAGSCIPGEPAPEQCNGIDDDCNGEVDDDAACADGRICHLAYCLTAEDVSLLSDLPDRGASLLEMAGGELSGSSSPAEPASASGDLPPAVTEPAASGSGGVAATAPGTPASTPASQPAREATGDVMAPEGGAVPSSSGCSVTSRPARRGGPFLLGLVPLMASSVVRRFRRAKLSSWTPTAAIATLVALASPAQAQDAPRAPSAASGDAPNLTPEEAEAEVASEDTDAAPGEPSRREANNVTYVELLGAGVFWTTNYERTVRDVVSFRLGFGIVPASIFVPVTVSYHGFGTLAHSLELAVGTTIIHWDSGGGGTTDAGGLFSAGYRYQRPQGGFFLRLGLDVHLQDRAFQEVTDGLVLPWPYLGIGGTFPP